MTYLFESKIDNTAQNGFIMKKAIEPYLHFNNNCRQAMEFYQNLFGGELFIMTIGESPQKDNFSPELHDQVMHAHLRHGELHLMASDACGTGEITYGNGIDLNLNCTSIEEIQRLYTVISLEGTVIQELKQQFWGALFAMVIDPFGVRWMLSLELDTHQLT